MVEYLFCLFHIILSMFLWDYTQKLTLSLPYSNEIENYDTGLQSIQYTLQFARNVIYSASTSITSVYKKCNFSKPIVKAEGTFVKSTNL